MLEILKVMFLGIVEGITEWLPISSTGHMILVEEFIQLNVSADFMEMFRVVIQLGAILAVVVLYFPKLWPFCSPRNGRLQGPGTTAPRSLQPSCRPQPSGFPLTTCWMKCSTTRGLWQSPSFSTAFS